MKEEVDFNLFKVQILEEIKAGRPHYRSVCPWNKHQGHQQLA